MTIPLIDDYDHAPAQDLPPLKVPLPVPPVITLGGVEYVLEHVKIDELDAYRREHGLVRQRVTFLGKPGWRPTSEGRMRFSGLGHVSVHVPESWVRGTAA